MSVDSAADPSHWARLWTLDPEVEFLNHGSFGSCPRAVLDYQQELRARIEREPIQFFVRELEDRLDQTRAAIGAFVRAEPQDIVFVSNATSAVNSVLRSLSLSRGDELIVTDHEYNACRNALDFVANRAGAKVVVARIPFPIRSADEVLEALLSCVSVRTRLALIDHVTSQTGLVLPIHRLVSEFSVLGIDTLVDGAHAPGMIPLDIENIGAAYYTGNCHKWLCSPKGAAFLYVRRDKQEKVRPLTISHGANVPRTDRSRMLLEFDWQGTDDPTAILSVPESIRILGSLLPGGWPELMATNRAKVLAGRSVVLESLGLDEPAPAEMIGSLASIPIPDGSSEPPESPLYADPLQELLMERFRIEVPIMSWPSPPRRLLRISAQLYNRPEQYEKLGNAIIETLAEENPI